MKEIYIELFFIVAFATPVLLLLIRYIKGAMAYMSSQELNWDIREEKLRLLFYIIFGGLSYLIW